MLRTTAAQGYFYYRGVIWYNTLLAKNKDLTEHMKCEQFKKGHFSLRSQYYHMKFFFKCATPFFKGLINK